MKIWIIYVLSDELSTHQPPKEKFIFDDNKGQVVKLVETLFSKF